MTTDPDEIFTPTETPRLSWTQPICGSCMEVRQPRRQATRVHGPVDAQTCVDCGLPTYAGIYIRVNPDTAAHPTKVSTA